MTENATHMATLRKTLRNKGSLNPILVWCEQDAEGTETGRLVLLDGHFRVHAYRAEMASGRLTGKGIPALVVKCDRVEAELAALSANTMDSEPLTMQERTDAAWALVRRHLTAISKSKLAKASGVSERTIANMRRKLRQFRNEGGTPTGEWWRDRKWPEADEFTPPSDAEKEALIAAVADALREALREHRVRDVEITAEAVQRALGQRELKAVVEHLGLVDDDYDEMREPLEGVGLRDDFGARERVH